MPRRTPGEQKHVAALRFELAGGRHLRPLQDADAPELHALIERNRPRLAMWMHWAQQQSAQQTLDFVHNSQVLLAGEDGLQTAIVERDHIIGAAGFPAIDQPNRSAGLGYWIDAEHEGRGIVTQAAAALVAHAFDHWRLHRVEIRADVNNRASRAVAERLGFTYEGTLRQAYHVVGERYSDDAVYSMLASEAGALASSASDAGRLT